jgi:transcriptional regulator with XRE-family HTH domain
MNVRRRTRPHPTNALEEAVDVSLGAVIDAGRALREEINQAPPDVGSIARNAEEVGRAARSLTIRSRRLERGSPYESAVDEGLELVEGLIVAAEGAGPAVADAIAFEAELVELLAAVVRRRIGGELKKARTRNQLSIRSLSRTTGLGLGYVSEIEGGRSGPPSVEVCTKLDAVLGTKLAKMVGETQARVENLKEAARERRKRESRGTRRVPDLAPRESARVQAAVIALANDDQLLRLVEHLIAVPLEARRAVARLIEGVAPLFKEDPGTGR